MSARLYVGNLPPKTEEHDIERSFRSFGAIRDISVKGYYGFVEFMDSRDADEAVHRMNNKVLLGSKIRVEKCQGAPRARRDSGSRSRETTFRSERRRSPREHRSRLDEAPNAFTPYTSGRYSSNATRLTPLWGLGPVGPPKPLLDSHPSGRRQPRAPAKNAGSGTGRRKAIVVEDKGRYGPPTITKWRVIVQNLSSRVSWQDLKDFMRQAGEVTYADCHRETRNEGVVCFTNETDLRNALDKLDGTELNGRRIRVVDDSSKVAPRKSRSTSRSISVSRSRSDGSKQSQSRSRSRSRSLSRSPSASRSRSKSASINASNSRSRSVSVSSVKEEIE